MTGPAPDSPGSPAPDGAPTAPTASNEFHDFVTDLARAVSAQWTPVGVPTGPRSPGAFAPDDPRVIWDWPDPVGRVIEDP
jgi:hypothetical protein